MTQTKLEDVESYLVKQAKDVHYIFTKVNLIPFLRRSFAELRAREQSKLDSKSREAVEANEELIADIEAEEAIRDH